MVVIGFSVSIDNIEYDLTDILEYPVAIALNVNVLALNVLKAL